MKIRIYDLAMFSTAVCMSLFTSGCIARIDSALGNVDPKEFPENRSCTVEYRNTDTLSLRDIYVLMRTDVSMERKAVELNVRCIAPDSSIYDGRVRVALDGEHKKGMSFDENEQLFCSSALLSQSGIYRFIFSHTYPAPLTGIWNVGVDIQPAANGKGQD